jgi:hypothetical protein
MAMRRVLLLTSLVVLALAGCSSSKKSSTSPSGGGTCGPYKTGSGGVVRTFCDGTADVKVTAGGRQYEIKGGTCADAGGYFTLNAGVVIGLDFSGAKPDYVGADFPATSSSFTDVSVPINAGGQSYVVKASGTVAADKKSGQLSGPTVVGPAGTVSVSFTC